MISIYIRASRHEKVTYEATINQLNGDLAAHKSHMQVLANRLDQIHFEVESKCEALFLPLEKYEISLPQGCDVAVFG